MEQSINRFSDKSYQMSNKSDKAKAYGLMVLVIVVLTIGIVASINV